MARQSKAALAKWSFVFTLMISITCNAQKVDLLYDFRGEAAANPWFSVNDGVMGGVSQGRASLTGTGMRFEGYLSLENNGGFASLRDRVRVELSEYEGIYLKVKGDGREYQLRLESDARYWGRWAVSFGHAFYTKADEWTEVFIPFNTLEPQWRGRKLKPQDINRSKIQMIGLLLGDKKTGPFVLEVAQVGAYR